MKVCSEKGFTGIDISVSVIVIFIFISIISLLVYRINSTSQEIQLKSDATYVAINEIENIKNYSYTVKIFDEQKAHELLKELVIKGITINKFEIMKPTLNDIFIEKVGE